MHTMRDVNFVAGFLFDHFPPNMAIEPYPQRTEDIDSLHGEGVTAEFNTQADEDFVYCSI